MTARERVEQWMKACMTREVYRPDHGLNVLDLSDLVRMVEAAESDAWMSGAKDRVALDLVSGALCDSGNVVPADPCKYGEAIREISRQRSDARKEALEEAAKVGDEWAENYPTDVFLPDSPSLDAKAAGHGRHVANEIAKDIRALASKEPTR